MAESKVVNGEYLMQKFPGKGGWTYVLIQEISPDRTTPFGWITVKGSIDDFPLKHYKLMPMGNGQLFLPVKAAIRKKIKKEAGDWVRVILAPDRSAMEIPQEILDCFAFESPEALANFKSFTSSEQKAYLDWIYGAKTDETKASRIIKMMDKLCKNQKLYDVD